MPAYLQSAYEKIRPASVRRVALWSAGMGTREFWQHLPPEFKSKQFIIIDSNAALEGKDLDGLRIHTPSSVDFSQLDMVVITSAVFHHEIREQLAQLGTYAGPIIDLYEERIQSYGLAARAKDNNRFISENGMCPLLFSGTDAFMVAQNGVQMALAGDDAHNQMVYHVIHRLYYEQAETELICRLLPPGGCFIDVGANVGWFSLSVARAHPRAQVHSFEPDAATYSLLLKNIAQNGVAGCVHPQRLALGEKAEKLRFTKGLDTGNHIAVQSTSTPSGRTAEVECLPLDDYVKQNELASVDFIKCDVEGAELLVLKGAQRTLETLHPYLLLEVVEAWLRRYNHAPDELFAFLRERGYAAYGISEDGSLRPLSAPDPSAGRNVLFVHKSRPLPAP